MEILIFANCHGTLYKEAIARHDVNNIINIEHIISYENLHRYDAIKEKFKTCDILIIQPVTSYESFKLENIKQIVKKDCTIIVVPFVRFEGFWDSQDSRDLNKFTSPAVMFFPNIDNESQVDGYLSGHGDNEELIQNRFNQSLEALRSIEKQGDVKFVDFFLNNYKETPLFRDPYHPTRTLYHHISREIINHIRRRVNLRANDEEAFIFRTEEEFGHFKPIKDSTGRSLGLKYSLDSVFPYSRSTFLSSIISYENSPKNNPIENLNDLRLILEKTKQIKSKMSKANEGTRTKFFITTPAFNSANTVSRTIASVISQSGDFEIHYHIQDGGSKDGTLELLERWKSLIESGRYPITCHAIHFSYESSPDEGMYDALCKGFANFSINPEDWMGWINSDDYFVQGAFSYLNALNKGPLAAEVNWITPGRAAIACEGYVTNKDVPRPISSYLIREGLCDGEHWDFVQQEGTFFRNKLWMKLDLQNDLLSFKLAGDWNLWRKFAQHDRVYQSAYALGVFNVTDGQLSAVSRDAYLSEIERIVPRSARFNSLKKIVQNGTEAQALTTGWNTPIQRIEPKNITTMVGERYKNLINKSTTPAIILNDQKEVSIVAYDADWQYPAITEKHAFECIKKNSNLLVNSVYIAFPWATLIDLTDNKIDTDRLSAALTKLGKFLEEIPKTKKIITTCQHIRMLNHRDTFRALGITDIFWTHATESQRHLTESPEVNIHPFPLFPVQIIDETAPSDESRNVLYSFVGARSNEWYLTDSRSKIIDLLSNDQRGIVIGRDQWHYNKIVYDHQIKNANIDAGSAINNDSSIQFKQVLGSSIFSLCPSGSGPNSIRLWESIGFGAIPVILADTYLPPGDMALWNEAAVFCKETEAAIKALPDLLEEMAKDQALIERKRHAMRQLWMMYGPNCFVYDIHKLALKHALPLDQMNPTTNTDLQLNSKANDTEQLGALGYMIEKILQTNGAEQDLLRQLLSACSSRILIDSKKFAAMYNNNQKLKQVCNMAQELQTKEADIFKRLLNMRGISSTGKG